MWFPLSSGLLYGFPHINMILHYTEGGFSREKTQEIWQYEVHRGEGVRCSESLGQDLIVVRVTTYPEP